jgi:hypothetical protein
VISRTSIGLGLLVLPGVLIMTVIVALVVWPVFGVAFPVALLIEAVLAATDSHAGNECVARVSTSAALHLYAHRNGGRRDRYPQQRQALFLQGRVRVR